MSETDRPLRHLSDAELHAIIAADEQKKADELREILVELRKINRFLEKIDKTLL
jgi:hypothetical protein